MAPLAWLALVLTPGMGATRTQKAMRRLGEPELLFEASLIEQNTLIKQGAKLTATWEDVWEDLPTEIRTQLEQEMGVAGGSESNATESASLFNEIGLSDHERMFRNGCGRTKQRNWMN
jgi:predicted Rossmann fold nucleotide-binding protein DprA/Smf involved in DNA uptake